MFPCDARYLHDKWNIKPRRVSPSEMLSRQTSRDFCTKIESTFPCRVVYVKTRNEFVSLYSRGGSERGNSPVKLNSRDYCSNINVKIPISAGKLVWEKPRRKNCNRHVAFLIHTVLSSWAGKAASYITTLLRSSTQFRENFISFP